METFHGFVPAEAALHASTIMTWPTLASVDGFDINKTRSEVANIVHSIAKYEPVDLFVSDRSPEDLSSVEQLLSNLNDTTITIHMTSHVDSLWARDTAPVFVSMKTSMNSNDDATIHGAVLNFNEWGQKLNTTSDESAACAMLSSLDIPEVMPRTCLHVEGGALEFDGEGTLLATESSILNDNRNPGWAREEVEDELSRLFGVNKVLWLGGVYDSDDITDAHVDGVARFVRPGRVLLHRPHSAESEDDWAVYQDAKTRLSNATDARGRQLEVIELAGPDLAKAGLDDEAAAEYVNYYVANGVVILASFGDNDSDDAALRTIEMEFPGRIVEQVRLEEVALQGGGIHCATQQIIAF